MFRKILLSLLATFCSALYGQLTVETFVGTGSSGHVDGDTSYATLDFPYGVATDQAGNLFIADLYNHCIRKVTPQGMVSTFAGTGVAGYADGPGASAMFNAPAGVFVDQFNFVYVCDNLNNRIRKIDPGGNVTTVAGNGLQGLVNGAAANAQFYEPKSLYVDANGVIFVADYENHVIRKISGGIVTTFAGSGTAGFANGTGSAAQFFRPRDLIMDASGNLFVTDLMNHSLRKITPAGVVTTFVGNGAPGNTNGTGTAAQLSTPTGITIDNQGNFYVTDAINPKIRKITSAGVVSTIAGSGTTGFLDGPAASARFTLLQDIAINNAGELFISDRDNYRIRVLKNATNTTLPILTLNSQTGVSCYGKNDGSASVNASGGSSPYSYNWVPGGYTTNSVSNLSAGTYTVTVTDSNNRTSTLSLVVSQPSALNSAISGNNFTCMGSSITLSSGSTGGIPPYTYNWNNGSSSGASWTVSPSSATTYTLEVTDANGCKDTANYPVNIITSSQALFTVAADSCTNSFFFQQQSLNAFNYYWDFGDLTSGNTSSPTHFYPTAGTYTVSLIINKNSSCSDTLIKVVTVNSVSSDKKIPNIFTPNGDKVNDVFKISLPSCNENYSLKIYDRWGLLIFQTDRPSSDFWDGHTTSGNTATDGSYFYVLESEHERLKGNVTLLR